MKNTTNRPGAEDIPAANWLFNLNTVSWRSIHPCRAPAIHKRKVTTVLGGSNTGGLNGREYQGVTKIAAASYCYGWLDTPEDATQPRLTVEWELLFGCTVSSHLLRGI